MMYALATISTRKKGGRGKNERGKNRKRKNEQTNGDVVFIAIIWFCETTILDKVTLLFDFLETVSYYNTDISLMWIK